MIILLLLFMITTNASSLLTYKEDSVIEAPGETDGIVMFNGLSAKHMMTFQTLPFQLKVEKVSFTTTGPVMCEETENWSEAHKSTKMFQCEYIQDEAEDYEEIEEEEGNPKEQAMKGVVTYNMIIGEAEITATFDIGAQIIRSLIFESHEVSSKLLVISNSDKSESSSNPLIYRSATALRSDQNDTLFLDSITYQKLLNSRDHYMEPSCSGEVQVQVKRKEEVERKRYSSNVLSKAMDYLKSGVVPWRVVEAGDRHRGEKMVCETWSVKGKEFVSEWLDIAKVEYDNIDLKLNETGGSPLVEFILKKLIVNFKTDEAIQESGGCEVEVSEYDGIRSILKVKVIRQSIIVANNGLNVKTFSCSRKCEVKVVTTPEVTVSCSIGGYYSFRLVSSRSGICPLINSDVQVIKDIALVACSSTSHRWLFWSLCVLTVITPLCLWFIQRLSRRHEFYSIIIHLYKIIKGRDIPVICRYCELKITNYSLVRRHTVCQSKICRYCNVIQEHLPSHVKRCSGQSKGIMAGMADLPNTKEAGETESIVSASLALSAGKIVFQSMTNIRKLVLGIMGSWVLSIVLVLFLLATMDSVYGNEIRSGITTQPPPSNIIDGLRSAIEECLSKDKPYDCRPIVGQKETPSVKREQKSRNEKGKVQLLKVVKRLSSTPKRVRRVSNETQELPTNLKHLQLSKTTEEVINTISTSWGKVTIDGLLKRVDDMNTNTIDLITDYEEDGYLFTKGVTFGNLNLHKGNSIKWTAKLSGTESTKAIEFYIYDFSQIYRTNLVYYTADRGVRIAAGSSCTGGCPKFCNIGREPHYLKEWMNDRHWGCSKITCTSVHTGCSCCAMYLVPDRRLTIGVWDVKYSHTEIIGCITTSGPKTKCFLLNGAKSTIIEDLSLHVGEIIGEKTFLPSRVVTVHRNSNLTLPNYINPRLLDVPDICTKADCLHGSVGDWQTTDIRTMFNTVETTSDNSWASGAGVSSTRTCQGVGEPTCHFNNVVFNIGDSINDMITNSESVNQNFHIHDCTIDLTRSPSGHSLQISVRPRKNHGTLPIKLEIKGMKLVKNPVSSTVRKIRIADCDGCYLCNTGFKCKLYITCGSNSSEVVKLRSESRYIHLTIDEFDCSDTESEHELTGVSLVEGEPISVCVDDDSGNCAHSETKLTQGVKRYINNKDSANTEFKGKISFGSMSFTNKFAYSILSIVGGMFNGFTIFWSVIWPLLQPVLIVILTYLILCKVVLPITIKLFCLLSRRISSSGPSHID